MLRNESKGKRTTKFIFNHFSCVIPSVCVYVFFSLCMRALRYFFCQKMDIFLLILKFSTSSGLLFLIWGCQWSLVFIFCLINHPYWWQHIWTNLLLIVPHISYNLFDLISHLIRLKIILVKLFTLWCNFLYLCLFIIYVLNLLNLYFFARDCCIQDNYKFVFTV